MNNELMIWLDKIYNDFLQKTREYKSTLMVNSYKSISYDLK